MEAANVSAAHSEENDTGNATMEISTFRYGLSVTYCALYILGHLNLWVIWHIVAKRSLRTATNVQLLNICLGSYLYSVGLPFVVHVNLARTFPMSEIVCRVVYGTEAVAKAAIIFSTTLASLERFVVICTTRRNAITIRRSAFAAVGVWLLAVGIMTPVFLYTRLRPVPARGDAGPAYVCSFRPPEEVISVFILYTTVLVFAIPTLAILASYAAILVTMLRSAERMSAYTNGEGPTNSRHPSVADQNKEGLLPPQQSFQGRASSFRRSIRALRGSVRALGASSPDSSSFSDAEAVYRRRQAKRRAQFRRVTRTIMAVIGAYLLCWLPYWLMTSARAFTVVHISSSMRLVLSLLHVLPYLNCAINPFIYAVFNSSFRDELLSCPCRPGKKKSSPSTAGLTLGSETRRGLSVNGDEARRLVPQRRPPAAERRSLPLYPRSQSNLLTPTSPSPETDVERSPSCGERRSPFPSAVHFGPLAYEERCKVPTRLRLQHTHSLVPLSPESLV